MLQRAASLRSMTNKRIENMLSVRGPGHLDLDPAVVEGAVVEIIDGAFRGTTARVSDIERRRQEVTVELFEAAVPVALTVRADQVELKLEPGCMVRIDTQGQGRKGELLAGLIGRVISVDEEVGTVKVRIWNREVLDIINITLVPAAHQTSLTIHISRECITITHCSSRALSDYCRHCDRLQGGGPRRLCEEHERTIDSIYNMLNEDGETNE